MSSTLTIYNTAIRDFKRLQDNLTNTQSKISSTSLANTFAELGSNSSNVQNYQVSIIRSDRYITSIQEAQRKTSQYDSAISQLLDLASSFKQAITLENGTTTASVNDLTGQADNALDNIRAALNSRDGANYLFSGSKTNEEPVIDLKSSNNIISGQATADYYNGDNFKSAVNVSSALQVEYGVVASNPAFQKLIGAINLAKSAESSGNPAYDAAGDMLDSAINDLTALRAQVGDNEKTLEDSLASHTSAKTVFQKGLADLNSPDVVQLSVEASEIQTVLQASFSMFSKISQLTLVNFLQ